MVDSVEEPPKNTINYHNSLIFWPICIKFGMWVHYMGVNMHVNFEDPESRIFGLILQKTAIK